MKPITHLFHPRVALGAALAALMVIAPLTQAVTLTNSPLFIGPAVDANVFFEIDDSGSMDWEILTTRQWAGCTYTRGCATEITNGRWTADYNTSGDSTVFEYIFDNSDNSWNAGCPDSGTPGQSTGTTLYTCDADLAANVPYKNDWRILASDFNVMYYDPNQVYGPWKGICDATNNAACDDADFAAARSNPRSTEAGYTLLRDLGGIRYVVWIDDKGYSGTQPDNTPNVTGTANGKVDLWDSHVEYTVPTSGDIVKKTYTFKSGGVDPTDPADWTITTEAITGAAADTERQNIANWYQYARKRSYVAKAGLAAVINSHPDFRYGLSVINQYDNLFVEVPDLASNYSAHNADLLEQMFALDWARDGTPLRTGLERVGNYYDNTDGRTDPIVDDCQKNFTVLFTDGYWNQGAPAAAIGDADGDGFDLTLADVAKYFYDKDLSDRPNVVPPDPDESIISNKRFDDNDKQHMVTFGVAFGVTGTLVDTNGDGWPDPALADGSNWGSPFVDDSPEKIDDLWHAAWNSHGAFITASKPGDVVGGLEESLQDIETSSISAASAAASTGTLQTGTLLFQAQFDPSDWHGMLLAFALDTADGSVIMPALADAGQRLPAAGSRTILTRDPVTRKATAFRWDATTDDNGSPTVNTTLQAALKNDATDTHGADRLAWLRGDATNEDNDGKFGDDTSKFRERPNSKLGDIIASAPVYVGAPVFRYPDDWGTGEPESLHANRYSKFKSDYSGRPPIIYAGANDGMLHGFQASGTTDLLVEWLAYVPSPVYSNLRTLTDPGYTHHFYVDGSPTYGDAFFDGAWHSVLAGGLNHGGQGIYALDITIPAGFSESTPANTVLWEFTDADDPDLGYTYSQPAIVRMHNGVWAAVFGNGYNNTDADDHVSTTGNAVLYIVDISDGMLIKKIDTGVGDTANPNGLATPAVVDINGDNIADVIYVGDLRGNLWKIDVNDADKDEWEVAYGGDPLFTATDGATPTPNSQPITSRPEVGRGPFGTGLSVYFGTGQYLGSPDTATTSVQTFYAIIDEGIAVTSGRTNLLEQTVIFQDTETFTDGDGNTFDADVRVVSDNDITTSNTGWFMDLPDAGERVVSTPLLVGGRIIYVTIVPDSGTCSGGGYSWLMEVNASNGGELSNVPFDLNNDGVFTIGDMVDIDGDGTPDHAPGGVKPGGGDGFVPTPVRVVEPGGGKEHKYMPSTSGSIEHVVENPGGSPTGRQSWRQVR